MEFRLTSEANDYLGKGMSGGLIVLRLDPKSPRIAHENWIAGNTLLYGATGGKVFISGRVGERFAVRNSRCDAVVEGVGDHGCEYMTGGRVVVLGPTGRNFAAGRSGGFAYVIDRDHLFSRRCNHGMIDIERPSDSDIEELQSLISQHFELTQSRCAERMLENWQEESMQFVKIMPREYRKIMARIEKERRRQRMNR